MSQQISPMLQTRINNQKQGISQNNFQPKVDLTQKPDTVELSSKEENKTDGKKILKIAAIGAAIAAAVAGVIYFIKKGQAPKSLKLEDMNAEKFKQLKADKFTGTVQGKLNLVDEAGKLVEDGKGKGDNIVMEYVDGVLKKSTRSGNVNFEKVYETVNGETFINKTVNGATSRLNLTELQNNVKADKSKLDNILSNEANLSAEEFKKQTDAIKYKNNKQKGIIGVVAESKTFEEAAAAKAKARAEAAAKLEAEAKVEAEKAKAKFEAEVAQEVKDGKLDIKTLEEKETDKAIKHQQDIQDGLFEAEHKPSGKSAKESFKVFEQEGAIDKAAIDEYQQRLQQGKDLTQRIEAAKGTNYGGYEGLKESQERIEQLKGLSKEQLAALEDKTIDTLVHNAYTMPAMENFNYLKGLTPEQIVKLQNSPHGTNYLNSYISGRYNTTEDADALLDAINKIIGR